MRLPRDLHALSAVIPKEAASTGEFELFKTSSIFDSTATHPEWLGQEPPHVRDMMPA
jgi:hypothetical protein